MGYEKGFFGGLFGELLGGKKRQESTADVETRLKAESTGQEERGSDGAGGTFRVQDVYKIVGVGFVPVGEVVSGIVRKGNRCEHMGRTYEITTIEKHHETLNEARAGDQIGMGLRGVGDKSELPTGTLLSFHG
jgi:selenocysteine-specific translation elongation factor